MGGVVLDHESKIKNAIFANLKKIKYENFSEK